MRALALRILRVTTLSLLALLLLAFALVQGQQYLLRSRATHLLADFHSLRLRQSTWPDAQRLISRWGAFGHYDGTCTAAECSYVITLQDEETTINSRLYNFMEAHWPQSYSGIILDRAFHALGGRGALIRMRFLVESRIVQRSSIGMRLDGPLDDFWCRFNCGYELMLSARASQSLNHETGDGPWILGRDEQLAQHPDYKAGRPSGCKICMSGEVTFTPYASQAAIANLTSYNLDCLTRHFHPCRTLPDVLPTARDWHLYPSMEGTPEPADPPGPPKPCDIPLFALGRDATSVLVVKVLSVQKVKEPPDSMYPSGRDIETAKVQVVDTLKGSASWPRNATINAAPYSWDTNFPWEASEHFEAGKIFIVMPDSKRTDETHIIMPRCGVFPDSLQVRQKLEKGFEQNDKLSVSEKFSHSLWW